MDDTKIDELVKKAYEKYQREKNPQVDSMALDTLEEFHRKIEQWGGDPENLKGITFYRDYLTGDHMSAIAAKGATAARIENFNDIMNRKGTGKKVAQLFCMRREHSMEGALVNKIVEVNFIDYVLNHPRREGVSPTLYTHRFLLSIFIEIMTSIADRKHLEDTAKLLGIRPEGVSFEKLQVQVRSRVEDSLNRMDIGNELTKFTRAAIAFHIKGAV